MTQNQNRNKNQRYEDHVIGQSQMIKNEKRHAIDEDLIREIAIVTITIHPENQKSRKRIVIGNDRDPEIEDPAQEIAMIVTFAVTVTVERIVTEIDMIAIVITELTESDDRHLIQNDQEEDHVIGQGHVTEN